jgi:hypothetical protein
MQVEPVTETKKDVEISKVASVNIAEKIYGGNCIQLTY